MSLSPDVTVQLEIERQRTRKMERKSYRIVLKTMRPIKQCDLEYNARKLPQTFHIMRPLI